MALKHTLPLFLQESVSSETYERWLSRKASAHVKRDRIRGRICSKSAYKEAIHAAVILSGGMDAYTGEVLNWALISTYKNEDSKKGRHAYKAGFALLPTVDHLVSDASEASFRICAWRTNDSKNDLTVEAFLELCNRVVIHAGNSQPHE